MFLGLIVIPIIGNAAEHAAAVVLSRKGQIDLGLQIALGSSTQIALLVAPLLVFAGVLLGQDMNLVFTPFEVVALGLATIVTAIITLDGESHWFEGVQLLAVYAMVAVGAFFLGLTWRDGSKLATDKPLREAMGADSPDDSLLFAGGLPGAGPRAPVGGGQRLSAAGLQPAGRGGGDRAPGASVPAVRGWERRAPGRAWGWSAGSRSMPSPPSCR